MNDESAYELTRALQNLQKCLEKQLELQEEENRLMQSLIPALQATAQELLDLREQLDKTKN